MTLNVYVCQQRSSGGFFGHMKTVNGISFYKCVAPFPFTQFVDVRETNLHKQGELMLNSIAPCRSVHTSMSGAGAAALTGGDDTPGPSRRPRPAASRSEASLYFVRGIKCNFSLNTEN